MATVGNTNITLVDVAKSLQPNGQIAELAEMMAKVNPILDDIPWKECNDGTSHRVASRTFLPTPTWRRYNQGVQPTKTKRDVGVETTGMMSTYSNVDVGLAKLSGNPGAFRKNEDDGQAQGFNIEFARALFYENTGSAPERIYGLTPRFASTTGISGSQVLKADSTASGNDQTSIWLIGWGPMTVYGIYPRGSIAGLDIRDMGERPVDDGSGNNASFQAYVTYLEWQCGLVVHDWRYVVRISNIDTSAWKADLSAGADLALAIDDAITAMFDTTTVTPVLYMNRSTEGMLRKQLKKRELSLQDFNDRTGRRIRAYNGIPIRVTDAITSTESVVS